jgi:hypothetical protein
VSFVLCAELSITPVTECYGQPTCSVDVHLDEHLVTWQITGFKLLQLPDSLDFDKYFLNKSFASDDNIAAYKAWMKVCTCAMVCVCVCLCLPCFV